MSNGQGIKYTWQRYRLREKHVCSNLFCHEINLQSIEDDVFIKFYKRCAGLVIDPYDTYASLVYQAMWHEKISELWHQCGAFQYGTWILANTSKRLMP